MVLQLEDFLPVYPNVTDAEFYQNLYDKYEFRELELRKKQETEFSDYLPSQKIVSRFLSPYTPYNNLLLYHEMGTGKTCAAVGVAENLKLHGFRKCVYISKGEGLHDNFKNEVAYKCTKKNEYLIKNKTTNIYEFDKKKFEEFYTCSTYQTFIINESSVNYDNCIFILDEVHNLIVKDYKNEGSSYNKFHQFLHKVKNCKILLLSGTPITDKENTFTPIMNLILPINGQIPDLDYDNLNVIKEKIKGYVSFLSSPKTDIRLDFIRSEIDDQYKFLENDDIALYYENMSDYQTAKYLESVARTVPGAARLIERQVSLFADPIIDSLSKNAESVKDGIDYNGFNNLSKNAYWKNFSKLFKGINTDAEKLNKLYTYSVTYRNTISNILDALKEDKKIFIYNSTVNRHGIYLFATILTKIFKIHTKKILMLTSDTFAAGRADETNELLNGFNNSKNEIKIILGSGIISEGFTFKNIEIIHVQTPAWNYSEIMQVIARGYRLGSHNDLIKQRNGLIPEVKVYLHASIPATDNIEIMNNSIDVSMYKTSAEKWVKSKLVEKIAKEGAIDCCLTKQRNLVSAVKDWTCDGNVNLDNPIDFSTYIMYYADSIKEVIRTEITTLFKNYSELNLGEIYDKINGYFVRPLMDENGKNATMVLILEILNDIIETNQILTNNIGIMSFLRCEKDTYFCVNNVFLNNDKLLSYYSASTAVFRYNTVNDWFENQNDQNAVKTIDEICNNYKKDKDDPTLVDAYNSLEPNVKESICSLASSIHENDFSKFVLKTFCVEKDNEPDKNPNDKDNIYKIMDGIGINFYGDNASGEFKIIWVPTDGSKPKSVACKSIANNIKDTKTEFCAENIIGQILNDKHEGKNIIEEYLTKEKKNYKVIQVKFIENDLSSVSDNPSDLEKDKKARVTRISNLNFDKEHYILVYNTDDNIPLFGMGGSSLVRGGNKLTAGDLCKIIKNYLKKNELIINPQNTN